MRYSIIYADPPWRYGGGTTPNRIIENHYPTMELEEIKKMRVPAEKNSLLYLWVTAPKVEEAIEVMNSWGFKYKTCMVWDKQLKGMGYWFRGQHELLFVGVRGTFSPPQQAQRVGSVLRSKRQEHSRKPDIVRKWIEEWYPDKTKIELFAREVFETWSAFGNEVPTSQQTRLIHKKGEL